MKEGARDVADMIVQAPIFVDDKDEGKAAAPVGHGRGRAVAPVAPAQARFPLHLPDIQAAVVRSDLRLGYAAKDAADLAAALSEQQGRLYRSVEARVLTDRRATRADIARGFEDAVVDTLAIKCARALDAAGCDTLVVAGGVGANHRLRERLQAAAERFRPALADLPHPRVAVLLGGNNRYYRLTAELAAELARRLADLAHTRGASFAITPSRRTDPDVVAALRTGLAGLPATLWDGAGDNPYFGYLALADVILVTADSVSMVSEACSTGKPVYVIELASGGAKFRAFHAGLQAAGCTRPFTGSLDNWDYPPLDDTARVAGELRRRLAVHRQALGVGE